MSGYRFDELTETWVVLATARRGLPVDPRVAAAPPAPAAAPARCPFCPGAESETEATVAALTDDAGAWRVRVVLNRYPTVSAEAALPGVVPGGHALPARGVHEVVVETPVHDADWPDFEPAHAAQVVWMYRERYRALAALPGARAVAVFRNRGRRAGSSQSHPHAQAMATTVLPHELERRHAIARHHLARTGRRLLDAVLERELALGARVVEATEAFVVLCPFAPRRAYETWIVPRAAVPSLGALDDALVAPLAEALARTTARVRAATGGADYNLVVRGPPLGLAEDEAAASGFHLEVLPRTGGDAGFELTTGIHVVPVTPEDAAAELRWRDVRVGPR